MQRFEGKQIIKCYGGKRRGKKCSYMGVDIDISFIIDNR